MKINFHEKRFLHCWNALKALTRICLYARSVCLLGRGWWFEAFAPYAKHSGPWHHRDFHVYVFLRLAKFSVFADEDLRTLGASVREEIREKEATGRPCMRILKMIRVFFLIVIFNSTFFYGFSYC